MYDCCNLIWDEFYGEKDRNLATSREMRRKRKGKTYPLTTFKGKEMPTGHKLGHTGLLCWSFLV